MRERHGKACGRRTGLGLEGSSGELQALLGRLQGWGSEANGTLPHQRASCCHLIHCSPPSNPLPSHTALPSTGSEGQVHGGTSAVASAAVGAQQTRVYVCTKDDPLRAVVERLAMPGVRRLIVIQPDTRCVEGIVSLSDVASFLFI